MDLAGNILLYLVSLGAAYVVISRINWSSVLAQPEGLLGILVRTFFAMFVFAVVFRVGMQVLIWLGVYGQGS